MPQEKIDTMEYVYAALLLHKLGKDVDEANLSSVVKASGAEVNEAQVKSLVAALADVNIDDAVKAAPVAVAAAAPAADAPAAGGEAKEEKKKEEPKNEEAAMEGLSSLFG
jgi:large subunit ribosomal protein L12